MEIKQYFNKLRNDITNSKTIKALKFQEKKARKILKEIDNPLTSSLVKKDAYKEYIEIKKLIKSAAKKIK